MPLSTSASAAYIPLQADLTGGGLLALVVTFLAASIFYAVTLHLAATFFIGDIPSQRAAYVGPLLAAISILLQRYGAAVVVPVTFVGDVLAIRQVYRLRLRSALPVALLHLAIAAALGFALANLLGLF